MHRLIPHRLTPQWLSLLLAAIATSVSLPVAPYFWFGVVVMVTALALQLLVSIPSDQTNKNNPPPRPVTDPQAAAGFLLATGAFIASGSSRFSMAAFIILMFYFRVWRILNDPYRDPAGETQGQWLPDPRSIRDLVNLSAARPKSWISASRTDLARWGLQLILIVILLARKGVST